MICVGIVALEPIADERHVGAGRLEGDTAVHTSDERQNAIVPVPLGRNRRVRRLGSRQAERKPQLRRAGWKLDASRHHGNDFGRRIIDQYFAADNGGVRAEHAPPQRIAHDRDARGSDLAISRCERATDRG